MAKDLPSASGLEKLAFDRLRDARTLLDSGSYHGAIYVAGYAVELALKARICNYLGWLTFDEPLLHAHKLDLLLKFSGFQSSKPAFLTEWNFISQWNPEMRYDTNTTFSREDALNVMEATESLLKLFL